MVFQLWGKQKASAQNEYVESALPGADSTYHFALTNPNRSQRMDATVWAETGQAMVETAMVILVLLMILLGFFDLGRVVVIYSSMTAAAQDAAHMGALTSNTGVIQTAATDRLILADPAQVTVTVDRTTTYTNVTLAYTFVPITPLIAVFTGPSGISLSQSARVAILGSVVP